MKEITMKGRGLSAMCRLCLSKDATLLDIFYFSPEMRNRLSDIIMRCAPVQIRRHDGMPNFICHLCHMQLEKIHEFQMKILQSDKTLRHYLQQLPTSDKQVNPGCSTQKSSEEHLLHETNHCDVTVKSESKELPDVLSIDFNMKETEPVNLNSTNKINEKISLKLETKDESKNDKSSNLTECVDEIEETFFTGDGSNILIEDTKVDTSYITKLNESTYNIGKEQNFKSMDEINSKIPLKFEIKDEPTDDNSLFDIECVDNAVDNLYKCDDSEICSENTKIDKSEESEKDISVNDKKNKIARGNKFQCDVCNKCFSQSSHLIQHKRTHTGEKPYRCDVCSKCFKRSIDLIRHKRTHTGEKPYSCDVCIKCFSQPSNLISHKRTHTGEKPYSCDVCNKCFAVSSHLNAHKRMHTGGKPYQCDICNKCFMVPSDLIKHKRTHFGEKPYQCDVCNKCFSVLCHLNRHKRTHTGEKPYPCDVCDKCFTVPSDLIKHKRTHTGEKPYQCDICNKSFTVSSNLICHKRIHTGEKPHKCDVCNKCFSRSSDLIPHKRMHTGEKPYQCDVCNKCFSRSSDLIPHKRTHSGEKPYKCDVCDKCFTVSRSLIVHKRTHTGGK